LLLGPLRHQLREPARKRQLVADHPRWVDRDDPRVDGSRERLAVAIDNIPALGNERRQTDLAAGVVTEGCEPQDPERDQRNDAAIDQHAEHQPLVHDREHLPTLADESEPLGPWRDESGGRCVHRPGAESLCGVAGRLSGSGASGSAFAMRTGFVIGWAAARPGLSTDFFLAGFAAVTSFSVDWGPAAWGTMAAGFTGTSRVSVLRLAS
jgi:hypothetical protein